LKTRIDRLKDKLLFGVPPHDYDIPWLPELLRAALDRQTVTAIYASERGTKRRTIHPVGLYSMNGVWYCPAIDDETGKLSTFRAERFQQVEISVEHSGKYSKRLAALSVAGCIFPEEAEAEDMALEVRMTSKGVLKCRSDLWLASRLTVNEDGSGKIMCSMKASFVQWAASFFLSLGKDAVVVQPEEVRQAIKDHIAETLPNYM
jgi:predicted DNA-binding transcriptional regulator YafY